MPPTTDVLATAQRLKTASRILFITGAGISADSGLPVYRGQGGLYNSGVTDEGIPFEEALSGNMLEKNRSVIWEFLRKIDVARKTAHPSPAHRILAEFQRDLPGHVLLATQNVDGLHKEAGSTDVLELHGHMYRIRCEHCGWHTPIQSYDELDDVKLCPECNYLTRPDVVLFGELLPYKEHQRLTDEFQKGFDIGFAIGTTGSFHYIRRPFEVLKEAGGVVVEINPCDTDLTDLADFKMRMTASNALEKIQECLAG